MTASAGMIGTDQLLSAESAASDRAQVDAFLAQDTVREQLQAWGVAPELAAERVARLSDEEVAQFAREIESAPAGAGALEVVGIVFVVLIILELVGVTNVFSRF